MEQVEHTLRIVAGGHHILEASGVRLVFVFAGVAQGQQGIGEARHVLPGRSGTGETQDYRQPCLALRLGTGHFRPVLRADVGQLVAHHCRQFILGPHPIVEAGEHEDIASGQRERVDLFTFDQVEAVIPRPPLLRRERIQETVPYVLHGPGAVIINDAVFPHHFPRRLIPQPDLILGAGREHIRVRR